MGSKFFPVNFYTLLRQISIQKIRSIRIAGICAGYVYLDKVFQAQSFGQLFEFSGPLVVEENKDKSVVIPFYKDIAEA